MQKKRSLVFKILGIALLMYVFLSVGFYVFQDTIIFQSEVLPSDYAFEFKGKFEEYFISTHDGERLNALLFRTKEPSKGLILYFHGNADNLKRWGEYAGDFTILGYDILMIDYRGYGKSTGTPTEADLYADALTVWNWSKTNVPFDNVIIYGRSLGSAVASNLASKVNPSLLILETPFDELKGVVYLPFIPSVYLLPIRFQFPNSKFLINVGCKKVIIHGTRDWVVPLSSASRLKTLLTPADSFVVVEGASHNNLRDFKLYHQTLATVLGALK